MCADEYTQARVEARQMTSQARHWTNVVPCSQPDFDLNQRAAPNTQ